MAKDPYQVLGVSKTADKKAIRSAYRKMAKKYHPDMKPGDKAAEEKFKEASAAFALLNNEEERARYDRGEIDADGNPRGPFTRAGAGGRGPSGFQPGGGYQGGFAPGGFEDISDILSELFGSQGARRAQGFAFKGEDVHFKMDIDLVTAIKGDTRQVRMADGKSLKLTIPAGIESGQSLRLKGQGRPGTGGGPPGDAIVEINVKPHKFYQVDGNNIRIDLPITLTEAVQGAKVKVPTPHGAVNLSIPANTSSGKVFRLKGKGRTGPRSKGDLLVRTMIMLPDRVDAKLKDFVDNWKPVDATDPRKGLF